ncbi:MAG: phosphoribosyltransferase [Verrucomicrobia bacterium]|nr:phosphoribosyltransferase [Verrucomicrobiota bacterium]
MTFASRKEAGEKLGLELSAKKVLADVILGLPRGGVIVAAEIARILKRPLDVLVVRKIGHPHFREFAVGALAEAETVVLDQQVLARTHVEADDLDDVITEEKGRLTDYVKKFEKGQRTPLSGKSVILADDGLATGATTEAAVRSARKQGAKKITVAVPVASTNGFARLANVSDDVISLLVDPNFHAVGQYYSSFSQTTDEEVLRALEKAAAGTRRA